jgi:hypothetical protein
MSGGESFSLQCIVACGGEVVCAYSKCEEVDATPDGVPEAADCSFSDIA